MKGTSKIGAKSAAKAPPKINEEPSPPAEMTKEELEVWNVLKKVLRARGHFTLDNQFAINALVSATAEFMHCRRVINREGRTYEVLSTAATRALRPGEMKNIEWGPEHYLTKVRPEVHLLFQADRRMRMWLCEFGLTEATRVRVTTPPGDEDEAEGVLGAYGLN
jgi:hypothetical protein